MGRNDPFTQAEAFLLDRAATDLPAVEIVDDACHALGLLLQEVVIPDSHYDHDVYLQKKACLYLGVQAGRALRSIRGLLCLGYQPEALVFLRKLHEVHARMQRVTHPTKGLDHARQWLKGQDGSAGRVLRGQPEQWKRLDHVVHADHRGIEDHLYRRDEVTGKGVFSLLPMRDTERANMLLVYGAILVRDVAAIMAEYLRRPIPGLDEIDERIAAFMAKHPDAPPYFSPGDGYDEDRDEPAV